MNEITFHFFNVGHGDSIVIHFNDDQDYYFVIDSNFQNVDDNSFINPAYEFLKSQGVKKISALYITHFHHDHLSGVENFLQNFEIKKICIPPVFSIHSEKFLSILRRYRDKLKDVAKNTNDKVIIKQVNSFTHLLKYLKENSKIVEEITGKESVIRIPESGLEVGRVYLPLSYATGKIRQIIMSDDFKLEPFSDMNAMSIAMVVEAFGKRVLLTGDSNLAQWKTHKTMMRRDGKNNLDTDFLKVSHHGSSLSNSEEIYEYLFSPEKSKQHIFISANGKSHPSKIMFKLIREFKLIPHCTNLSKLCLKPDFKYIVPQKDINLEIFRFLLDYNLDSLPIPCQNDIRLRIDKNGYTIENSNNSPCIYNIEDLLKGVVGN